MTIAGLAFTFVLGIAWQSTARAAGPWYVTPVGSDRNDCRSTTTPCKTITSAIKKASSGDTINVAGGTYTEALTITKDLIISGEGVTETVLDGGQRDRVIYIPVGSTVSIADVMIQRGRADRGVGIYNGGKLTLTTTAVSTNTATTGGGIYNDGTLTLTSSSVTQNVSEGARASDISSVSSEAGGIYNANTATLSNSTITNNRAEALAEDTNSPEASSFGGGIVNDGTLTMGNVTVSGNTADAYAYVPDPSCEKYCDTIADADSSGGGIANRGEVNLSSVTVARNQSSAGTNGGRLDTWNEAGGGIVNISPGTFNLVNSLVAENSDSAARSLDCSGPLNSQGYNLIQDVSGCTITGVKSGNITGQAPHLGLLRDNGGPTQTHALLWRSPALDAGKDAACPSSDQRGVARPVDGDGDGTASCDIGAYELAQPYIMRHVYVPLVHR